MRLESIHLDCIGRLSRAAVLLLLAAPAAALAQPRCGELGNAFGPYDFRKDRGEPLQLVEGAHFKAQVESLSRGQTAAHPGGDIDYTLRAFPNHHRALLAVIRLGERDKIDQPRGMNYTVECYLDRAVRFKPDDHIARMILAGYLNKQKRIDDARKQLTFVAANAGESAFTHYNAGLLFMEIGDHGAALVQAHRAAELGFPRTDLRDKLQAVGKWSEPAAASAASQPAGN